MHARHKRMFGTAGAVLAAVAVMAGAFGAHALEEMVSPERLETFQIGVQYHMTHALALLLVAWASRRGGKTLVYAGYLFLTGITVFSGSLYLLVLTDTPWLGAVTPLGGVAFIAGWLTLAWGLSRPKRGTPPA